MTRLLRSIVLTGFVASLLATTGCVTRHMPVEAEAAAGLPLIGPVLPTWDERARSDKIQAVPRNRVLENESLGWAFLETVISVSLPLCLPRWDARSIEPGGWWEKRYGRWSSKNPGTEKESDRTTKSRQRAPEN